MTARRRDTTALAFGSAISGLLAYVVFALTTRALGAETSAPVSVLWSYWSFTGAAFTFPLQHWIARTVTAHGAGAVRQAMPQLSLVVVGASVLLGGLAWLVREPLFHRDDLWFPSMVALVTFGSALIGVVRGGLSAQLRFTDVAWTLVAENGVRCVAVGVLFLADVQSAVGFGLCLVAGHLVAILWPSSVHFGKERTSRQTHTALAFLSGAALAQLLGQIVLTGGPVVLALAGGSPSEVTALFAVLALFRAPYILALGMVAQLTTMVSRLVVAGKLSALRRMRNTVVAATAVAVALAALAGAALGPTALPLIFGSEVNTQPPQAAVVAIACTFAVANLVVTVRVLALGQPGGIAWSWLVAVAAAGLCFTALSALSASEQTTWSFLSAEVVAFAALLFVDARETRSTG